MQGGGQTRVTQAPRRACHGRAQCSALYECHQQGLHSPWIGNGTGACCRAVTAYVLQRQCTCCPRAAAPGLQGRDTQRHTNPEGVRRMAQPWEGTQGPWERTPGPWKGTPKPTKPPARRHQAHRGAALRPPHGGAKLPGTWPSQSGKTELTGVRAAQGPTQGEETAHAGGCDAQGPATRKIERLQPTCNCTPAAGPP